jgi:hypothetical protein
MLVLAGSQPEVNMRFIPILTIAIFGVLELPAQAPTFTGYIDEYCTVWFSSQSCTGLGCASVATIRYDIQGKSSTNVVTLEFGSNDEDVPSASLPEAVTAKALLQLGKQGWELQRVTYDEKIDRRSTGVVYHLRNRVRYVTKG